MQRLRRDAVETPTCLCEGSRLYKDLRGTEKTEIRTALLKMQGNKCAYCERRTGDESDEGHIEHFRNQAGHSALQLEWTNLFWSCSDEKTCGKHKDKCQKASGALRKFNPKDIVDPAREDPERFFLFVSDGTIRPASDLNAEDLCRAEETLRVFALNDSSFLRKSREDAVKPYIRILELLSTTAPASVAHYIECEWDAAATAPFSAAIKAFLRSVSPNDPSN